MGCLEMLTLLLYFSGQNDMCHLQKLCFLTHLKCFQMKSFSGICTHLFKNITMQFLPISLEQQLMNKRTWNINSHASMETSCRCDRDGGSGVKMQRVQTRECTSPMKISLWVTGSFPSYHSHSNHPQNTTNLDAGLHSAVLARLTQYIFFVIKYINH